MRGPRYVALRLGDVSPERDGGHGDVFLQRRLVRHWQDMGFVPIPGRETVLLPLSARLVEIQN
ncbi:MULTISPECIES: hypothetical protein [Microbacterium]|uniref:hypothetical protein n=1 Tax=Microbacterium TaxID=33882 RepID=UPI000D012A84|nr:MULTISPECIES: hypothetical protein [Microbacterium]AVL98214.1 hypothetical protein C6C15_14520 [Microbacterium sp. str. 'China']